jgi:hypothetical protein
METIGTELNGVNWFRLIGSGWHGYEISGSSNVIILDKVRKLQLFKNDSAL